jgi:hypothetical protein
MSLLLLLAVFVSRPIGNTVVPAGDDAFEFFFMPSLVGELVFQRHLEPEFATFRGLADPRGVILFVSVNELALYTATLVSSLYGIIGSCPAGK